MRALPMLRACREAASRSSPPSRAPFPDVGQGRPPDHHGAPSTPWIASRAQGATEEQQRKPRSKLAKLGTSSTKLKLQAVAGPSDRKLPPRTRQYCLFRMV